ncbi:MAG: tail fiber assembly protein [Citrobacter portucalensis]
MNKYAYSAVTNAFYPVALKSDYENADSWPKDALEVDDSVYLEFSASQPPAGKRRGAGETGLPAWFEIPVNVADSGIHLSNLQQRDALLTTCAAYSFAIQSSAVLDKPREGDNEALLSLQQYADNLRDVDLTLAEPDWPEVPTFLTRQR